VAISRLTATHVDSRVQRPRVEPYSIASAINRHAG